MRLLGYQRRLSLILSVLIAAGGLALPELRHSHAGGDRPHCHHNADHQDADHEPLAVCESIEHLHAIFLGWPVALPCPVEKDPHRPSGGSPPVQFATASFLTPVCSTCGIVSGLPPILPRCNFTAVTTRTDVCFAIDALSVILCDTARHERSACSCSSILRAFRW
jgi:hypothetical protein